MKICPQCQQSNPEDARFCLQCGALFESDAGDKTDTTEVTTDEQGRMRTFIGPNADRYLAQFKKFTTGAAPRFTLTWHWPAFLFDPFLWFLYRKMYLYAFVYAIGPVVTAMLTGDITVGVVWRVIAGASANYIYFWHVKEQLAGLRAPVGAGSEEREGRIREAGGVQPYVIWVGVALHIFLVLIILKAIQEGSPDGMKSPRDRLFPTPGRNMKTQALVDLSASPSVSQPLFLRQPVGVHLATEPYPTLEGFPAGSRFQVAPPRTRTISVARLRDRHPQYAPKRLGLPRFRNLCARLPTQTLLLSDTSRGTGSGHTSGYCRPQRSTTVHTVCA